MSPDGPYRVLARKYRPVDFSALIGQEAMVRTLTNALATGRLAHAYMLTGVRGIGKTTTARILARALNCEQGPTMAPCGICLHCRAIGADSDVDVIEMDAASRTGVNDIRELIEGVRYRPVAARYKIYIIDEVHMLSVNAFNALLKTLEEPPPHVKFIFATTEIRKVPVTVLSRCQRFDLRRVEQVQLAAHFTKIAAEEGTIIDAEAAALIARAADGSVRDGLSLLDQAIASAEQKQIGAALVRDMLGLADRTQLFTLAEHIFAGEVSPCLALLDRLHEAGADPIVLLQDLLDLIHWLTRITLTPDLLADPAISEAERVQGGAMAQRLSLPVLGRAWQALLKGLAEAEAAPDAQAALEMALIRLMHLSPLPPPGELLDQLGGPPPTAAPRPSREAAAPPPRPTPAGRASLSLAVAEEAALPLVQNFADLVRLVEEKREAMLRAQLTDIHLVHFEPGRIEFRPSERTPANFATKLSAFLKEWTGRGWFVSLSSATGQASMREQKREEDQARRARAIEQPLVKAALKLWPEAEIETIEDMVPFSNDQAREESE
jgi:DNA polymerase-3 subunit gamma/tau